uniref:Ribonuclease VapC n=1 Tax=Solibacter usitatus (strain Ellin6076) TaxID=234267 RepID=Q02BQ0_SOLUE
MILDTNGLSAIADGDPLLEPILARASELALPVIVLGEYRYGIAQSRNRIRYEKWLKDLVSNCRVLNVDDATAAEYAILRSELKRGGSPIPANDVWIAALARQHSMPVISRDEHFDFVPKLKRLAW